MALVFADRIKETSTTTSTSNMILLGATTGFKAFSSVLANADTCYYCIDDNIGNWEIGLGTWTTASNTLTRTTVLSNSLNDTSKIVFSAGTKDVFITIPAAQVGPNAQYPDSANNKTYRVSFTNGIITTVEV